MTHIADDRNVGVDDLVDRRWVDVDMGFFRAGAEILHATGDPVIEPRADIDHQIAIVHRQIGLIEPVHSEHTQPALTGGWIGAEPH